jgi:hypothetical protein
LIFFEKLGATSIVKKIITFKPKISSHLIHEELLDASMNKIVKLFNKKRLHTRKGSPQASMNKIILFSFPRLINSKNSIKKINDSDLFEVLPLNK